MPVGNSDKGVGLSAGDIMVSSDFFYQFIDWRHDQIDASEPYGHEGTLSTTIISPNITIGLSDWWNLSFQQIVGTRHMGWELDETSVHHREEHSHSNFLNAIGGYLGDSRLMLRYLASNTGRGQGSRLFFGLGYVIPSKNTLSQSPFLKDEDESSDTYGEYFIHRHFSMSPGVKKIIFETQYYYKKIKNPVFLGGSFKIEEPLSENEHGFSGSRLTELSFSLLFNKNNFMNTPYGLSILILHENEAFWDDIPSPNSESIIITPSMSLFWNSNFANLSLGIQLPFFLNPVMSESGESNLNAEAKAFQISLSMRKVLDYSIPWLYW